MRENYLEDFYSFLRFPSVSTDEKFAGKVRDCAEWLSKKLEVVGLESKLVPTAGHPVVWARNKHRSDRPTVLVSDTGMIAPRTPTLSYGLRGVAALEVKVTGAKMDLHSGIFGGAVANPATALARLLATLHDSNGHIAVPGFYDDVAPLQQWERDAWKKLPIDPDSEMLEETGAPVLFGEAGFSTLERIWARPTAEINGMGSGYQGPGTKTVLPSHAMAKLTFRLVPNQNGDAIIDLV